MNHNFIRSVALFRTMLCALAASAVSMAIFPGTGVAQDAAKPAAPQAAESKPSTAASGDLATVLAKMNQSSKAFKSAQGDFEFRSYQKLTDDTRSEKRRVGKECRSRW